MFRYPGGKSKLYKYIEPFLLERLDDNLIVPFVGAGHETTRLLSKCKDKFRFIWLNDIDCGITSIWKSVRFYPLKFIKKINRYTPIVNDFFTFKTVLNSSHAPKSIEDITDIALMKLAIHQISYSGLGVMAGGPIGGVSQTSKYDVACRWNAETISKKVWEVHNLLSKSEVKITSWDFEEVLKDKASKGLVYLDPPYVEQGNALYKFGFTTSDHWRLSEFLYQRKKWVLSYDDVPLIHKMYDEWADINSIEVKYSIKGSRTKNELIICDN